MMNLNIPSLESTEVRSVVFKVMYLTNGINTKIHLTEKEKTIFTLFKGLVLLEIDEENRTPPFCYYAQLDTSLEHPIWDLLYSVFDEFLPLYYNDNAYQYKVLNQPLQEEVGEITVSLLETEQSLTPKKGLQKALRRIL